MTMYTEGLYHSSLALNQDQIHLNIRSYLQAKSGEQGNENRDNLYFVITLNSNGVKQGSPTPGHRQVPVCDLLETGPHGRR